MIAYSDENWCAAESGVAEVTGRVLGTDWWWYLPTLSPHLGSLIACALGKPGQLKHQSLPFYILLPG